MICFFFFKQKTAYEMRISDWSSDVCSSDLDAGDGRPAVAGEARRLWAADHLSVGTWRSFFRRPGDEGRSGRFPHQALPAGGSSGGYLESHQAGHRDASRACRERPSQSAPGAAAAARSEAHTSELQSQMRISYAVFCLKQK